MGKGSSPAITVGADLCILLAFSVFFVPALWVFSWCLAVLIHELCHYVVLRIFQIEVTSVTFSCFGATMLTGMMEMNTEIFCALAGPVGSFILVTLYRITPVVSICAFFHLLFNLLPIYPFDGGRVVNAVIGLLFPKSSDWMIPVIENASLVVISVVIIYFAVAVSNKLFVISCGILLILRCKSKMYLKTKLTKGTITDN